MGIMVLLRNDKLNGFTLIEILIAIFIFAIVMSMLFSSFHSALSTTEAVRGAMTTNEMAKICIQRVVADLQSIYLNLPPAYTPPGMDAPPEHYRLEGDITSINGRDFSKLRFTSSAHLSLDPSGESDGIAEIVYYVDQTEEDVWVMRRSDKLYPFDAFEANKNDPVLCEKIKSLAFTYYDEEGTEHEVWDSESLDNKYATPWAIGIVLEIGDENASQIYKTKIAMPVYRDEIE